MSRLGVHRCSPAEVIWTNIFWPTVIRSTPARSAPASSSEWTSFEITFMFTLRWDGAKGLQFSRWISFGLCGVSRQGCHHHIWPGIRKMRLCTVYYKTCFLLTLRPFNMRYCGFSGVVAQSFKFACRLSTSMFVSGHSFDEWAGEGRLYQEDWHFGRRQRRAGWRWRRKRPRTSQVQLQKVPGEFLVWQPIRVNSCHLTLIHNDEKCKCNQSVSFFSSPNWEELCEPNRVKLSCFSHHEDLTRLRAFTKQQAGQRSFNRRRWLSPLCVSSCLLPKAGSTWSTSWSSTRRKATVAPSATDALPWRPPTTPTWSSTGSSCLTPRCRSKNKTSATNLSTTESSNFILVRICESTQSRVEGNLYELLH